MTGLVLQSAVLILALVPIGAVAGWTSRHPFDLLWNYGLRHLTGAPPLPPNPTPRRHAFKLVAVCGLVTTTNFCVPSTLFGVWWRRHGGAAATT